MQIRNKMKSFTSFVAGASIASVVVLTMCHTRVNEQYVENSRRALEIGAQFIESADSELEKHGVDFASSEGDFWYFKEQSDSLYKEMHK